MQAFPGGYRVRDQRVRARGRINARGVVCRQRGARNRHIDTGAVTTVFSYDENGNQSTVSWELSTAATH